MKYSVNYMNAEQVFIKRPFINFKQYMLIGESLMAVYKSVPSYLRKCYNFYNINMTNNFDF